MRPCSDSSIDSAQRALIDVQSARYVQTASAFGRVEGALSFFVKAYPQLAEWRSVIERLDSFERSIAAMAGDRAGLAVVQASHPGSVSVA